MLTFAILIAVLLILLFAAVLLLHSVWGLWRTKVPYVPTARWAAQWLVQHLDIPDGSVVYDLGCGDAGVLALLAKRHPNSSFIGVEIQWLPALIAHWRARRLPNLNIQTGDFWALPVSNATHVFCYLFIPVLARMKEKFEHELRPGSLVISYGFKIPDWPVDREVADPAGRTKSRLLFYSR